MEVDTLKTKLTTPGAKHNLQFATALREYFEQECGFTDEEQAVLRLKGRGKNAVQIAQELYVSVETVNRRIKAIKNKIADIL